MAFFKRRGVEGATIDLYGQEAEIVREFEYSFSVKVELGGLVQHVLLSRPYVEEQLGEE